MYVVYGKSKCPFCDKAKELLTQYGKAFTYIDIEKDEVALNFVVKQGFKSLPQIYFDDFHVGRFNNLKTQISLNNF